MKEEYLGIVRRMDDLGRICIPREVRERLGIEDGVPFEMLIVDGNIVLRKYVPFNEPADKIRDLIDEIKIKKLDLDNRATEKLFEAIDILRKENS